MSWKHIQQEYRRRTRTLMMSFTRVLVLIFHSLSAPLFYVCATVTALSFASFLLRGLIAFLTAPIGLKPETNTNDFADAFWYLLLATFLLRIVLAIARAMKRSLPKPPTPPTPPPPFPISPLGFSS